MPSAVEKQLKEINARVGEMQVGMGEMQVGMGDMRARTGTFFDLLEEQGVKFRGVLSDVLGVVRDLRTEMVEMRRGMISLRTDLHDDRALDERVRSVESALKTR